MMKNLIMLFMMLLFVSCGNQNKQYMKSRKQTCFPVFDMRGGVNDIFCDEINNYKVEIIIQCDDYDTRSKIEEFLSMPEIADKYNTVICNVCQECFQPERDLKHLNNTLESVINYCIKNAFINDNLTYNLKTNIIYDDNKLDDFVVNSKENIYKNKVTLPTFLMPIEITINDVKIWNL